MSGQHPMLRAPAPVTAALVVALLLLACAAAPAAELQGHRGARGLMPENTLPGFVRALAIGVHTLELDLGMTADGVLVVSHDRALNPALARGHDGRWIAAPGEVIHHMTHAALSRYDVGRIDPASRYARRFPHQQPVDGTRVPALADVLALVARTGARHVKLNVETKLSPQEPELTPAPDAFAGAVIEAIRVAGLERRVSVQSFDWRTLRHVQAHAPELVTSYLTAEQDWLDNVQRGRPGPSPWTAGLDVDDFDGSLPRMVKAAGGRIWSPFFREVTPHGVAQAHALGLRVVVWTVNELADAERMLAMGVDGIITDYPDRIRELFLRLGIPVPDPVAVEH